MRALEVLSSVLVLSRYMACQRRLVQFRKFDAAVFTHGDIRTCKAVGYSFDSGSPNSQSRIAPFSQDVAVPDHPPDLSPPPPYHESTCSCPSPGNRIVFDGYAYRKDSPSPIPSVPSPFDRSLAVGDELHHLLPRALAGRVV